MGIFDRIFGKKEPKKVNNDKKKIKKQPKKKIDTIKKVLSSSDQKKKELLNELKKISKTKTKKSILKVDSSKRNSIVKKVHHDIIKEFNFQLIDSKKNKYDQNIKNYESPNKYFQIEVVENRSFYIHTPRINGFQFTINELNYNYRLQENIFKMDVLKTLENNFSDWNINILDTYNFNLLKTFFLYKQNLENEKEGFSESYNRKLENTKSLLLNDLDMDGNGVIDIIENNDFMKLLKKHQSVIKEFDKNYINYLEKISNFLKSKRNNIQQIFTEIKKTQNQPNLNKHIGLLKNQIHFYEVLLFHSLNLINSIVQGNFITVNEIYEEFDKLKIFKSDHEKEVSEKLSNIGDKLDELLISINNMESNIINGLNNLTYVIEDGFEDVCSSVTSELESINSSIGFNNLLTGIQTYQMYKINKNTKSLRS